MARFVLDEWVVNERIELKKNPTYWDNADTHLTEVTYIPFENQNASINRYAVGEVDITSCATHTWRSNLKPNTKMRLPRCLYCVLTSLRVQYYRPPFDDARVRKAVARIQ
ncbi:ABC transporter substrate-binding protein [Vibrio lentus]|nr:ABC transporter substrate-binding protein [Vibrio lentus]